MSKINMIFRTSLVSVLMLVGMCACEQEETTIFDQPAGVHFTINEYSYSFSDKIGVDRDTIKIPMEIYGKFAPVARTVEVGLVEGDTAHVNTILPGRYKILESVIPADSSGGAVVIEVNYGEEMKDSVYVFHLQINANEEFPEVDFKRKIVKVSVTGKEIQPANWAGSLSIYFGDYSTRWWGFIKEATHRTSLPYWGYHNPDPDLWTMTDTEFLVNVAVVKTALRKYNESPEGPLVHDDGPSKGKNVEMRQ